MGNNSDKINPPSTISVVRNKLKEGYSFHINNNEENAKYKFTNNTIRTTKYNVITFIPKALLYQFMRVANIYFLLTAILNCIKIISPLASGIALVPILFVLSVSLIRELIEDVIRARMDKKQNFEPTEIYDKINHKWITKHTGELVVGDIVRVKQDKVFPADLILLDSELAEGLCYIETASLDGEKSLKVKQGFPSISGKIIKCNNNLNVSGFVTCDKPNAFLYLLNGKCEIEINQEKIEFPLDSKQLLLKGAVLKNTPSVVGVVAYAGNNCKIMLNSKKPRMKYSTIEKRMNKMLVVIFVFQIILCIFCAIMHKSYYNKNLKNNNYLNKLDVRNINADSAINFFSYVLLYQTMIPISLIITMEIVKIIQAFFIYFDAEGYSIIRQKHIQPHNTNLNEEMGMIDYIFTDKTGTLTCNKMQFKFCVIGDVCYEYVPQSELNGCDGKFETNTNFNYNTYGLEPEEILKFTDNEMRSIALGNKSTASIFPNVNVNSTQYKLLKPSYTYNAESQNVQYSTRNHSTILSSVGMKKSIFESGIKDLNKEKFFLNSSYAVIDEFWKALALCHDCSVEGNNYVGLSPDSIALIKAARAQSYEYVHNAKTSIRSVKLGDFVKDFKKLQLFEFSSDRKRESIIVKEDDTIKLYIKGADSEITKRLSHSSNPAFLKQCQRYAENFSSLGFRTLFVAMKTIPEAEYNLLEKELLNANYDMKDKKKKLNDLMNKIEKDVYLLGATIVEDKLQNLVPETIRDLKFAGIKFWMLTGDKMSTAFNIALSCNLLSKSMKTFFIEGKEIIHEGNDLKIANQEEIEEVIITFAKKYNHYYENHFQVSNGDKGFGIIIDENALHTLLNNEELKLIFLNIAINAASVICCRVSPLQKSQVVKMVQEYAKNKITVAVGDGGNDVSMIMQAHIGIGIYGEEGMRAVQASDFAIGEFRIMRQLFLFHGRTNNIRICKMILFFFYKNFIFTIMPFLFSFYSNFSAQTIIDDWFINMYNLLFTALPLGVRACIDFDVRPDDGPIVDQLFPFLYKETKERLLFNPLSLILSLFKGIVHGSICYFFIIYSTTPSSIDTKGNVGDIWFESVTIYTCIIFIVSFDIAVFTKYHTWINFTIMGVFTFLAYGIFLVIVHYGRWFHSRGTMEVTFGANKFYLSLFLVSASCCLMSLAISALTVNFSNKEATYIEILIKKYGTLKDIKKVKRKSTRALLNLYNEFREESLNSIGEEDQINNSGSSKRQVHL